MRPWIGVLLLTCGLVACGAESPDEGIEAAPGLAEWTAVEARRIDAATADLSRVGYLLVADNGDILVSQTEDGYIKLFRPDGTIERIGRSGGGPGEFQRLTRIGWLGDSIWTLDPSLGRISIFGPDYRYVRSFRDPGTGVESDGSEAYATFIQAVVAGGDLRALISPRKGAALPEWLATVDSGGTAYATISPTGEYRRLLATQPPEPCRVSWPIGEGGIGFATVPFCARPVSTDWDGGEQIGFVTVEASGLAAYRVVVVGARGDTTVDRRFDYQPIAVTQAQRDSAAQRRAEIDATMPPHSVAGRPELVPAPNLPPVIRLVLGRDGSVWLELEDGEPTHRWTALGPDGAPRGTMTLPVEVHLRAAELGRVWATFSDEDGVEGIVEYNVAGS